MNPFFSRKLLMAFVVAALMFGCVQNDPNKSDLDVSSNGRQVQDTLSDKERTLESTVAITEEKAKRDFIVPLPEIVSPASRPTAPSSYAAGRLSGPRVLYKRSYMMAERSGVVPQHFRKPSEPLDRENYAHPKDNPVQRVAEHPVSTFSIDVDTGAYSNMRRMIKAGRLPRKDAIRVEELINYFSYDYPLPEDKTAPFNVVTEMAPTPWNKETHLLHVGIKGYDVPKSKRLHSNLVFLVDVSGSMRSAHKLDLLKSSLKLLSAQASGDDRIAIVVYAGASGVVLESTAGNERAKIHAALDALQAGGSTNGGAGIRLAYAMAQQSFIKGGINRVLLATDGDFNVGTVNFQVLKDLIEEKRKSGISLTTLGFGAGNYNDHLMEQLADAGNGNYAYIDTLNEAQKVLVDEMSSTLQTIAKDVKIQIEFNPAVVEEYRLIGYENRMLKREDFSNDKVDAGEIGAGHTVTALYEISLKGSKGARIEALRYGANPKAATAGARGGEVAFLRIRHKQPNGDVSKLQEWPINKSAITTKLAKASQNFRFSAAVAAFSQLLKGGQYTSDFKYTDVISLARSARGRDRFGYRGEFINLANLTKSLDATGPVASR